MGPIVPQPQLGPIDFAEFDFGGFDEFDRFDIWDNNVELPPVEQVEAAEQLEATESDEDLMIRDPNRSRTTKWRDLKKLKATFDRETIAKAHGDQCGSLAGKKLMQRIDRNPAIADAAFKYVEALDNGDGMYTETRL